MSSRFSNGRNIRGTVNIIVVCKFRLLGRHAGERSEG